MSADNINLEFIERYQKLFEKDPKSKVFAPLGEAYRKMGLIQEAISILENGVKLHPHFASGRVAYAKVLVEQKEYSKASEQLLAATDLSPENLLAQKLLAECFVHLKKPKEALRAFKMVMFLNPNDAHAQMHIKKLESLTADEYEDDIFEMKPLKADISLKNAARSEPAPEAPGFKNRQFERIISLTDAFIARLDFERALETIESSENMIGKHPELDKRKRFISDRIEEHKNFIPEAQTLGPRTSGSGVSGSVLSGSFESKEQRIDLLKNLLHKIESRR
jgi:tetratricopeptide (TPR) repeat protein